MLYKRNKMKNSILILLSILLILSGCSNSSGSKGYTLADQKTTAEERVKNKIEHIKVEKREEFDKMYANEIYLEDLLSVKEDFKNSYSKYIEQEFSVFDMPITYELDIQFYNSSLLQAKNDELDFDAVISNPGEHIRYIDLRLSFFREDGKKLKKELKPLYKELKNYWEKNYKLGVIKTDIIWSVYDKNLLENVEIRTIQNQDNQLFFLDPYKKCLLRNIFSTEGMDSYYLDLDSTQEELDNLAEIAHEKYKEDFIGIVDLKEIGLSMCAPANDISLAFETDGKGADKYITLLVQKAIYEEVDKILLDVGLNDVVVPIVIPKDRDIPQILKQKVDYPQQLENEMIINEYFDTYTDITLYYLIDDLKDIDYDKLQDFYLKLDSLFIVRGIYPMPESPDFEEKNLICFAFYFKDKNSFVRNIYKEKIIPRVLTTKYFEGGIDLNNLASAMYVTDDNSELSQLIKIYTEKEEQITDFVYIQGNSKKIEVSDFIEHTTDDSIYAD